MSRALTRCGLVLAVLRLSLPGDGWAGEDAGDILKRLEKKYDSVHDVKVSFSQHVRFGVTEAEQSFSGTLVMRKGNKYRIELEEQTIVTDGKTVWSYSKYNHQVVIDNYKEDPNSFSPDKVLVNVPDRYGAAILGKEKLANQETTIVKLNPKDSKSTVQWMKLWVDDDESLMRKVQVLDVSDNLTTYVVDSIALNTGVKESQFRFDPPGGVEVIDLR